MIFRSESLIYQWFKSNNSASLGDTQNEDGSLTSDDHEKAEIIKNYFLAYSPGKTQRAYLLWMSDSSVTLKRYNNYSSWSGWEETKQVECQQVQMDSIHRY